MTIIVSTTDSLHRQHDVRTKRKNSTSRHGNSQQTSKRCHPTSTKHVTRSRHSSWDVTNSLRRYNPIYATEATQCQKVSSQHDARRRHNRSHGKSQHWSPRQRYHNTTGRHRRSSASMLPRFSHRFHRDPVSSHSTASSRSLLSHHRHSNHSNRRSSSVSSHTSRASRYSMKSQVSYRSSFSRPSTTLSSRSNVSHKRALLLAGSTGPRGNISPSLKSSLLRTRMLHFSPVTDQSLDNPKNQDMMMSEMKKSDIALALSKINRPPIMGEVRASGKFERESEKKNSFTSEQDIHTHLKDEAFVKTANDTKVDADMTIAAGSSDNQKLKHVSMSTDAKSCPRAASTKCSRNAPIMQGFLKVRAKYWFGKRKRWFFVLRPSGLEKYDSLASFQNGCLSSCMLLVGATVEHGKISKGKFSVCSGKHSIRLIAESQEAGDRWVNSLQRTIESVTPLRS